MKKILFVASIQRHFKAFHMPVLEMWHLKGYEVHVASKDEYELCQDVMEQYPYIIWHNIDFDRSPFSKQTIVAYKQLKTLMDEQHYELVHVHTPVASILGRLAAKNAHVPKIVYTAHGFHFFKGAPIPNWLIYYPIEKYMARYTDALITINEQDYQLAKTKFKLRKPNGVHKINGVGIDLNEYAVALEINYELKTSLGIPKENFVITIIGELNHNKNQIQMLQAVEQLNDKTITLVLVGTGINYDVFKVKYQDNPNIKVLGYRNDVQAILTITDIVGSMSYREGLPKNVMEAMAASKPVIATNIRGNQDLVVDGETGYLVEVGDIKATTEAIIKLKAQNDQFGEKGRQRIEQYRTGVVLEQIGEIYENITCDY
ncbi:MAG: glycosyltransferase family 4 protein [Culicoidibacterales bacterium]